MSDSLSNVNQTNIWQQSQIQIPTDAEYCQCKILHKNNKNNNKNKETQLLIVTKTCHYKYKMTDIIDNDTMQTFLCLLFFVCFGNFVPLCVFFCLCLF